MDITREAIQERKNLLEKELDEALSRTNALGGAIQDCDYWLSVLEQGGDNLPASVPDTQEKATTE